MCNVACLCRPLLTTPQPPVLSAQLLPVLLLCCVPQPNTSGLPATVTGLETWTSSCSNYCYALMLCCNDGMVVHCLCW